VQVLEDQHDGCGHGQVGERTVDRVEQLELADVLLRPVAEPPAHTGHDGGDRGHVDLAAPTAVAGDGQRHVGEQAREGGVSEHRPLPVGHLRHRLGEREVGETGLTSVEAAAGQHDAALVPRERGEFVGQPGLADTGVAGDEHRGGGATSGLFVGAAQPVELPVTCHQRYS
jgi:hypothetical protein